MGKFGLLFGLAAAGAAGEYGIARYFFCRTVMRGNAKRERTRKMAGTDWDAYIPAIRASKEWLSGKPQEDVYIPVPGFGPGRGLFPWIHQRRAE